MACPLIELSMASSYSNRMVPHSYRVPVAEEFKLIVGDGVRNNLPPRKAQDFPRLKWTLEEAGEVM